MGCFELLEFNYETFAMCFFSEKIISKIHPSKELVHVAMKRREKEKNKIKFSMHKAKLDVNNNEHRNNPEKYLLVALSSFLLLFHSIWKASQKWMVLTPRGPFLSTYYKWLETT